MEFLRLRLGHGKASLVDDILSEINDPDGVIDETFRQTARDLHETIQNERKKQGLKVYSPAQAAVFLQGLANGARFHKGQLRKTGEPYFEGHLVPTVENLVNLAGITGEPTLAAGLLHDANEDHDIPLQELLPASQIGGLIAKFPHHEGSPFEPAWIDQQVQHIVDGMTKVKRAVFQESAEDLEEVRRAIQAETLFKVLQIMEQHGPRVIIVKGAGDRIANLPSLNVKSERSRNRTLDETEGIYIPFLGRLHVRLAVAKALDLCVYHRNPNLEAAFEAVVREKKEALDCFKEKILDVFSARETGKGERKNGRTFLPGIVSVDFLPPKLADFIPPEIPLQALDIDTLNINPLHPLFEIRILVEDESMIREVSAILLKNFIGRGDEEDLNHPVKRGVVFYFRDLRYGGNLKFRINVAQEEARSKRGLVAPGSDALPPELKRPIAYVLGKLRGIRKRSGGILKDPSAVRDLMEEEFLQPEKRAFAAFDGRVYHLTTHASYLDFARMVHPDLLIGLQEVLITRKIHGNTAERQAFPFDEFPDGAVIRIKSCLQRTGKIEPEKIRVTPAWLIFAQSQATRDAILSYLREPHSSRFNPQVCRRREELAKTGKDPSASREVRNAVLNELKTILQEDEKLCAMTGEHFLQNIALLLGVSLEEVIRLMQQHCVETKGAKERTKIFSQTGRGSVDILRFLAETFGNREKWTLEITLPNVPREEEKFMNDASFGDLGINIDEKHWPSRPSENPNELIGSIVLSDHSGKLEATDFFKLFIKLQLHGYRITLKLEPQVTNADTAP